MEALKKLKTFESACKIEGLDPKKVIPSFENYPEQDRKAMVAHAKLVIIVRAANRLANEGKEWKPDFQNDDQRKYYAWFIMDSGSSGFRFYDYDSWRTFSVVSSRLCFISREVCEFTVKAFIKLYNEYLL